MSETVAPSHRESELGNYSSTQGTQAVSSCRERQDKSVDSPSPAFIDQETLSATASSFRIKILPTLSSYSSPDLKLLITPRPVWERTGESEATAFLASCSVRRKGNSACFGHPCSVSQGAFPAWQAPAHTCLFRAAHWNLDRPPWKIS